MKGQGKENKKHAGLKHQLSIDIETFSSVDLKKSGLFKYAQSPDFAILFFAYSLDGAPVQVVDFTAGETLPSEITYHLFSGDTLKHAYNAPFEWYCLSRYFGVQDPESWLPQWRCSMLQSLYCGYPAGLDATGEALGLTADQRKAATGKALIRYFCLPCKPTKTNGGRTRNLPGHDPEKWRMFQDYCRQDVVTEMAVQQKLAGFPVPAVIQRQWETDQRMNARGVAVDLELTQSAIWCMKTIQEELTTEARRISGLDNPNSLTQLRAWLCEKGETTATSLTKASVDALLESEQHSTAIRRMLEIRQLLSKTSIKKYHAINMAVCGDGRIRGLMQFYGANRTGRWAGRIVQPQNLPRTYLSPLSLARNLLKEKRLDALRLCYGDIPDTLSQLIRTALVAPDGQVLIDADFSAIEARVIAWLADEAWRLAVFRTHGKIYEASASAMFDVPISRIERGNPEYALRQKGKVAELALGYQGGPGALVAMGALDMGLEESELPEIVSRWRGANPAIVSLWNEMNTTAIAVITGGEAKQVKGLTLAREYDHTNGLDFFTIALPSGRKLYYANPAITQNRWGNPSIRYFGLNQTVKKWQAQETYGGKLVENVVQAIARDCLAEAIERLEAAGYPVVFHVHDEVVIETTKKHDLETVCQLMREPMPWAPDLPLDAEGWTGNYYRKE